jgi:hypothetical protein
MPPACLHDAKLPRSPKVLTGRLRTALEVAVPKSDPVPAKWVRRWHKAPQKTANSGPRLTGPLPPLPRVAASGRSHASEDAV